ncbi:MAG: lysophospholipid acyltransferase family protein [Clostridiaceae bacterium]|nr:lysophospholipid acyltransferase family protein [Clostridiaceae bacterium]
MNQRLLNLASKLPEPMLRRFIRLYVNSKIKTHVRLNVEGLENLDTTFQRPFLFVCNHLSNADALLLNKVLEKEDITFVAGKKLRANSVTKLGFKIVKSIPISPDSPDMEAIKKIVAAVKAGNSILIFPEGTRSRSAKMNEGKRGILLFAKLTGAPIAPLAIWGSEKFMPIKEDMAEETFHNAKVHIRVGEVFRLPQKGGEEGKTMYEDRCFNQIMTGIASLLPPAYQGVYEDKT